MKIGAIICEFNPLHNGHLYLIKKAKKECDFLIAILSGDFNQRGIPSLVNKKIKAQWALQAGFDLVVENPFEFVIQSADYFASGAIMCAKQLKVTDLYFGSENFNKLDFENILKILINNDHKIKEQINSNTNYPRLIANILKNENIELNSPNDLLGLSYLKAIYLYKANININPIKRLGGFHSLTPYNKHICSATYIRHQIEQNNINTLSNFIPEYVLNDLQKHNLITLKNFEGLILKNVYQFDKLELKNIFGVDEGLENRIKKMLPQSIGLNTLIEFVKTKRYTYNRLQRMFLLIGLNILKSEINNNITAVNVNILKSNALGTKYLDKLNFVSSNSKFDTKIKKVYNGIITNTKGEKKMSFIVEAQIEIQKNSRNKYETLENGKLKLDRVLPSSQVYPTDYGFFNNTLGQDGDPLDCLILSTESLLPTALVDVRVVGVMFMVDGGEKDEKILAVVAEDPRFEHINSLSDVPEHTLKELANYFSTYKQMQNKVTEVIGFEDVSTAKELYNDAVARFNK